MSSRIVTREEVAAHNTATDQWLIVDDQVYDISTFQKKHPGGRVISYYKGQDATEPVKAFHPDTVKLAKWLAPLRVGTLEAASFEKIPPVVADFRKLRKDFEKEGRFNADPVFFVMQIAHVLLLELLGILVIYIWGWSFWSGLIASLLLGTAQSQAGWSQHDYGHLSVFKDRKTNALFHHFTIGVLKGASAEWWKTRHNRHHAKTNVIDMDPDLHTEPIFVFTEPLLKRAWKLLPYQHLYWWFIGPPLVTSVIFVPQNVRYVFAYRLWGDLLSLSLYFIRFGVVFSQLLPAKECLILYFAMRFWESHWFTWVTSMSHLPRPMTTDKQENWIQMNADSTQNITANAFHDWFTGHLNYQLEHHLFPSMPRNQLPNIAPRVQALCEKHGVPYHVKSMYACCCDIIAKLASVGKKFEKQYLYE